MENKESTTMTFWLFDDDDIMEVVILVEFSFHKCRLLYVRV